MSILDDILLQKGRELVERARRAPLNELRRRIEAGVPPTRGFAQAIRRQSAVGGIAVIAEMKKASPSRGELRAHFDPAAIAAGYERGGATCLSVLTDEMFFQGSDADLVEARQSCGLPVLRKDFIIDPYQVYESRLIGADCILLIVAALGDPLLMELAATARDLGMDVLIEVHDEAELERAAAIDGTLVGINNRNLRTFETSLDTTVRLAPKAPGGRLLVAESGIRTREDIARLHTAGAHAFLVGETFMRSNDPGQKLKELLS